MIKNYKILKWQFILGAVVCAIVAFCALPGFTTTGQAADVVTYIDRTWDEETKTVKEETKECNDYEVLTIEMCKNGLGEEGKQTWYILNENIKYGQQEPINITGNVNLILKDDEENEFFQFNLKSNATLTIYGQEKGTGKITVDAQYELASIRVPSSATLNIKGGTIIASGVGGGAAIGGNRGESAGKINILGGNVTAMIDSKSPGLGDGVLGGTVDIYGGNIVVERK